MTSAVYGMSAESKVGFYVIGRIRNYLLRVCTLVVVSFLAATTFFTIGITMGANFIAVLTIFDTFTIGQLL